MLLPRRPGNCTSMCAIILDYKSGDKMRLYLRLEALSHGFNTVKISYRCVTQTAYLPR